MSCRVDTSSSLCSSSLSNHFHLLQPPIPPPSDIIQEKLGDVVYVELPEVGAEVERGEQLSVLESVKAVAEVYTSLSGKVTEVNEELENSPNLVNEEPFDNGRYYTPLPLPIIFHGILFLDNVHRAKF